MEERGHFDGKLITIEEGSQVEPGRIAVTGGVIHFGPCSKSTVKPCYRGCCGPVYQTDRESAVLDLCRGLNAHFGD
jgi:hypothetical protein